MCIQIVVYTKRGGRWRHILQYCASNVLLLQPLVDMIFFYSSIYKECWQLVSSKNIFLRRKLGDKDRHPTGCFNRFTESDQTFNPNGGGGCRGAIVKCVVKA